MKETAELNIEGMSCGHCANAVKNLIEEVGGIETVEVNLGSKNAEVSFDPESTNPEAIIENINSSNIYKATLK